jgi:3-deoxy-D-manno-octulosonic-acid transferase
MNLAGHLYGLAGRLAAPALRVMLARRVRAAKEIPARLPERFGIATLPRPVGKLIWFHAASVGETMSILPVIAALAGGAEVLLTTGTLTSARLAAERLPAHARHQFNPLDVAGWVEAFLGHWRPDCAVFVESELWPATLAAIDSHGIPRLLINARLSARSAARWRVLRRFAGHLLFGFRWIHVQSAADARNFAALGAAGLLEWGNLKFAVPVLPVDAAALDDMRGKIPGPVWLAASTHPGEEAVIAAAHEILLAGFPDLITIIAPRHPERGAWFAAPRRSLGDAPIPGEVFIADTLGELGLFYRLCPFAFVGRSLVGHGGQNVIEPARLGRPVITGPHTANFAEAVAKLRECGALVEVAGAADLAQAAEAWLRAPQAARDAGERARAAFDGPESLPGRLAALILATSL